MSLRANHFELFDLPITYDLDLADLTQRYRELQRVVHPDNFANASERDRRLSMQQSTQLNEAFQTLKDPLWRGRYLLQLQGLDPNTVTATAMNQQFLLEQMELREELAALTQLASPLTKLNQFITHLTQKMHTLTQTLSQQLAQNNYPAAGDTIQQFQFFKRLHQEALALEEEQD